MSQPPSQPRKYFLPRLTGVLAWVLYLMIAKGIIDAWSRNDAAGHRVQIIMLVVGAIVFSLYSYVVWSGKVDQLLDKEKRRS